MKNFLDKIYQEEKERLNTPSALNKSNQIYLNFFLDFEMNFQSFLNLERRAWWVRSLGIEQKSEVIGSWAL